MKMTTEADNLRKKYEFLATVAKEMDVSITWLLKNYEVKETDVCWILEHRGDVNGLEFR